MTDFEQITADLRNIRQLRGALFTRFVAATHDYIKTQVEIGRVYLPPIHVGQCLAALEDIEEIEKKLAQAAQLLAKQSPSSAPSAAPTINVPTRDIAATSEPPLPQDWNPNPTVQPGFTMLGGAPDAEGLV